MTDDQWLARLRDERAIEALLVRYSTAIDGKAFNRLDEVFTADAVIDYRKSGGIRGSLTEIKAWLAEALAPFEIIQHLIGNLAIAVDGDTATATCYFYNPMGLPTGDGLSCFVCGGIYRDRLVRTPAGWRIAERVNDQRYMFRAEALPFG